MATITCTSPQPAPVGSQVTVNLTGAEHGNKDFIRATLFGYDFNGTWWQERQDVDGDGSFTFDMPDGLVIHPRYNTGDPGTQPQLEIEYRSGRGEVLAQPIFIAVAP